MESEKLFTNYLKLAKLKKNVFWEILVFCSKSMLDSLLCKLETLLEINQCYVS